MNGVGVGDLRVVLVDRYQNRKIAWVKSGRQGPGWCLGHVSLEDLTAYVSTEPLLCVVSAVSFCSY